MNYLYKALAFVGHNRKGKYRNKSFYIKRSEEASAEQNNLVSTC